MGPFINWVRPSSAAAPDGGRWGSGGRSPPEAHGRAYRHAADEHRVPHASAHRGHGVLFLPVNPISPRHARQAAFATARPMAAAAGSVSVSTSAATALPAAWARSVSKSPSRLRVTPADRCRTSSGRSTLSMSSMTCSSSWASSSANSSMEIPGSSMTTIRSPLSYRRAVARARVSAPADARSASQRSAHAARPRSSRTARAASGTAPAAS